jgi:alanine racemase
MKTHIEINAANLIHNLEEFRKLTAPKTKLMFVVKANAYGHGIKEVISITRNLPFIDYYAVDSVEEAIIVKSVDSSRKILVIGWTDGDQIKEIIQNDFEMVAPSMDYLKNVVAIAKEIKRCAFVHLKVETGTSRLGMPPKHIENILNGTENLNPQYLKVTGLYSHFANIEDTTDHAYAEFQLETFNKLLTKIDHRSLVKHFSCSAATLLFPKTHFDIARVGIAAYGFWPSKPTYVSYMETKRTPIQLKPVLSWYAKAAQVKDLEKGEPVGYGLTYRAFDRSRIIVVPVGYYDGYDRKLSNSATIILQGTKAPVRGRVCMNMFMAEVTHIKDKILRQGDRIILVGQSGDEKITIDELADMAGTINYEFVSRLNPLIPRVVV